jgi:hypothetical protein
MPQLANRRHEIFALELASGAPLLSAYLAAGYREGYSARFNASRLRNTPRLQARIDELLREHSERTSIKLEWVENQIAPFLEIDPAELYEPADPDNPTKLKLKPLSALPERVRKAITRIRVDESGRQVEFVLADKIAVANALIRGINGTDGKVAVNFAVGLGDKLDAAIRRVRQPDASRSVPALAAPRPTASRPVSPINKTDLPMEI